MNWLQKNRYMILLLNKKTIYYVSIQTSKKTEFLSFPDWHISIRTSEKTEFLSFPDWHISIRTSEKTEFLSIPDWRHISNERGNEVFELPCLTNYDPMGCSKTSFPRLFGYIRSNGMLKNFVFSLVWINMIQWDAQKLRFFTCLDKYVIICFLFKSKDQISIFLKSIYIVLFLRLPSLVVNQNRSKLCCKSKPFQIML